jgi:UDP-glucose 4-epimerase
MSARRIGVIGANGLVGSAVAQRFAADSEVVRIGRDKRADRQLDLDDLPDDLAGRFAGLDAVVHCAGATDEDFVADRERAWARATLGASRLAAALRAAGVGWVVYVSTAHVYGALEGEIDETAAPDPRSDYAIAHFASEQIFRRAGFHGATIRACAIYGDIADLARFRRWSLIPFAFPRMAVREARITLVTSGDQKRNFVSSAEVADCVASVFDGPGGFGAVNAVGPEEMSVRDFAELVAARFRGITGRLCGVVRGAGGAGARPLAYRSVFREPVIPPGLAAATDRLIARLIQAEPT